MKKSQGFTLIELVVVIVILGILSAVAIPRLIRITDEAYAASVNGIGGALRSAVALAQAQYVVTGDITATTVDMDGTSVLVSAPDGIPTGAVGGIGAALLSLDGFAAVYGATSTFRPNDRSTIATCQSSYDEATGVVIITTGGC